MRARLVGLFAIGTSLALGAVAARADEKPRAGKQEQLGKKEQLGQQAQEGQLSGTVVKAEKNTLYIEHMGAVIPLKIVEGTKFSGEGLESSRDLFEGQEVRASFTVQGETTNVASSIHHKGILPESAPMQTEPGAASEKW